MDASILSYYKTIGEVQNAISNATTLDEALQSGLRIISEQCNSESAVMWYAGEGEDGEKELRPFYWLGPVDLTQRKHSVGEGAVGRVFETQKAVRAYDFQAEPDEETTRDFTGMEIGSMLCVPFSSTNEDLGVIQFVNSPDTPPFTEEEGDICEIMAMMAALAIEDNEAIQEPWKPGKVVMSLRNITREFQNGDIVTKVLKGVNLDVYEGEFLVLLGESGCGKSTLLNIIGGMDKATSGTFSYLDADLTDATQQELTDFRRDNVGFIFQSYNLMPNLTALQNLRLTFLSFSAEGLHILP